MERRFFRDVIAWSASILLGIVCLNYVVDPFDLNQRFELPLPKDRVSYVLDYRLYKLLQYRNHPEPVVLFGDSRCDAWKTDYFRAAGLDHVFNFSFGGGTLYEAIDAFWYAVGHARVREVILCVPFNLYSETNAGNLFSQARELAASPGRYYVSTFVLKASLSNLYTAATGRLWRGERPAMDREAFWQYQLGPDVTGLYYRSWQAPRTLRDRLEELRRYCQEHSISLQIVIPPTHVDLQAAVGRYGLQGAYASYRCELASLADVTDLDFQSALTSDANNFKDPYHLTDERVREVVAEVVAGAGPWLRRYSPSAPPPACDRDLRSEPSMPRDRNAS